VKSLHENDESEYCFGILIDIGPLPPLTHKPRDLYNRCLLQTASYEF
jgi:hypothetical protein